MSFIKNPPHDWLKLNSGSLYNYIKNEKYTETVDQVVTHLCNAQERCRNNLPALSQLHWGGRVVLDAEAAEAAER